MICAQSEVGSCKDTRAVIARWISPGRYIKECGVRRGDRDEARSIQIFAFEIGK